MKQVVVYIYMCVVIVILKAKCGTFLKTLSQDKKRVGHCCKMPSLEKVIKYVLMSQEGFIIPIKIYGAAQIGS